MTTNFINDKSVESDDPDFSRADPEEESKGKQGSSSNPFMNYDSESGSDDYMTEESGEFEQGESEFSVEDEEEEEDNLRLIGNYLFL
jgi:hypothetical protein